MTILCSEPRRSAWYHFNRNRLQIGAHYNDRVRERPPLESVWTAAFTGVVPPRPLPGLQTLLRNAMSGVTSGGQTNAQVQVMRYQTCSPIAPALFIFYNARQGQNKKENVSELHQRSELMSTSLPDRAILVVNTSATSSLTAASVWRRGRIL